MYWIPPEWSKELRLDPAILPQVDTGVDCRDRNWDTVGGDGAVFVDNHCQTTTPAFGADHPQSRLTTPYFIWMQTKTTL